MPVVFDSTLAWSGSSTCASCHDTKPDTNAHTTHVDGATYAITCQTCHITTTTDSTSIDTHSAHVDLSATVAFNESDTKLDGDSIYQSAGDQTCDNTYCHSDGTDAALPVTFDSALAWGESSDCSSCHAAEPTSNAHTTHIDNATYNFACNICHISTTTDGATIATYALHVNQAGTVVFDTDDLRIDGSEVYVGGVTKTCSGLYCHGNFALAPVTYRGGGDVLNVPAWETSSDGDCGTCHGFVDGVDNVDKAYPRTGVYAPAHKAHVGSNAQPGCSACHESGSLTDHLGTYGDFGMHADGNLDQAFGGAMLDESETVDYEDKTAVYGGAVGDGGGSGDTCTNVRCHNGVVTLPFNSALGTIKCGGCHGDYLSESPTPQSIEEANTLGSHSVHVIEDAFYDDCANCHGAAVETTYTASSSAGGQPNHQNLVVDIDIFSGSGSYDDPLLDNGRGGVNYENGTADPDIDDGTCSTTTCHGGTPTWGGSLQNACFSCHNANGAGDTEAAGPAYLSDTSPNIVLQSQYEDTGHGLASGNYDLNAIVVGIGDGLGRTNPTVDPDGAKDFAFDGTPGCYTCHDSGTAHAPVKDETNDPYRLGAYATTVNDLCLQLGCHDDDMDTLITHHEDYGGDFTFNVKCVDCHDPHGDSNMFMIHDNVAVDGDDVALGHGPADNGSTEPYDVSNDYGTPDGTRPVVFIADTAGSDFASTDFAAPYDGICEVCHDATAWYGSELNGTNQGPTSGGAHDTADPCLGCHTHENSFKGGECDSCHGFPPAAVDDPVYLVDENYAGGGGMHVLHVEFLATALGIELPVVATDNNNELCGPCHGENAGKSATHQGSTFLQGSWDASARQEINIDNRTDHSWGVTGAAYGTDINADTFPTMANAAGDVMDDTNSTCYNVDCHGTTASDYDDDPVGTDVQLSWALDISDIEGYDDEDDALERAKVCEACHDETPADIRVYDSAGALQYDTTDYVSQSMNAAANYYAPIGGYGRGGHGDPRISDGEDPFFDSAPSRVTPIDCTACHDSTTDHLPADSSDIHRLGITNVNGGDIQDLCLDCHDAGGSIPNYLRYHHPSYDGYVDAFKPSKERAIEPVGTQEIGTAVDGSTSWIEDAYIVNRYDQSEYGAGGSAGGVTYSGNPDVLIDFWGSEGGASFDAKQEAEPVPVLYGENDAVGLTGARAVLPLERWVIGGGTSEKVLCTTCHNPHGTSLFAHDPKQGEGPDNTQIPDNNMLRMKSSDSTLCNACH
jgi:predicted CxxxxCH...CXXCH cytochrome family protein